MEIDRDCYVLGGARLYANKFGETLQLLPDEHSIVFLLQTRAVE